MHVLHRPHLPRAIAVTLAAAVLAIVLTLALASAVSDLGSAPASTPASSPPAVVKTSATGPEPGASPFMRSPFSSLVTAPVLPPWSRYSR